MVKKNLFLRYPKKIKYYIYTRENSMETSFDYDPKPIIPIGIVDSKENLELDALIDSGSDINFSYVIIGKLFLGLKFPVKPTDKIIGIDRNVSGWTRKINVKICNENIAMDVLFLNKRRFDPEKDTPIVLGREPLFQKFDVEFKGNKKITFRK